MTPTCRRRSWSKSGRKSSGGPRPCSESSRSCFLEPWKVEEMYFWSFGPSANWWIDISDYIDLKIQALREHKSQLGEWDPDEMIRDWARASGAGQLMEYAESYRRLVVGG